MIQEYYRQMRKFGCNILAVVQQYDIIKDSPVRGAMIGNSKMFLVTAQQSREDACDIGEAVGLSQKTVDTIHNYPLPELMDPSNRFSAFRYIANDQVRRLAHCLHVLGVQSGLKRSKPRSGRPNPWSVPRCQFR
jgi:hypothetical protein